MSLNTLLLAFTTTTQTLGLPPKLMSAICFVESSHIVSAVNPDDGGSASHGVCQIKLDTARLVGFKGTAKQLMRPKTNVYWAGKYLKKQLRRYNGDVTKAIAAYNAGKYRETEDGLPKNINYVDKVYKVWLSQR